MDYIAFQTNISQLGYDKSMFKRGLKLSDTQLCIKIHPGKSYLLPRFNKAIAAMKQDGAIDRIINKHVQ